MASVVADIIISAIIYLAYPTTFERAEPPQVVGSRLLKLIYRASFKGMNCVPSLHCSLCYIVIACSFAAVGLSPAVRAVAIITAVLIVISTLTTKQAVPGDFIAVLLAIQEEPFSLTKIKEDGGVSFKNAIKAAGFAEDDFKITYNAANITITAKAEGKNVIKGFKVTGGAAPDTAKFTKDAVKNGRGVNKSDILKLQVGDTNDEFNKILSPFVLSESISYHKVH